MLCLIPCLSMNERVCANWTKCCWWNKILWVGHPCMLRPLKVKDSFAAIYTLYISYTLKTYSLLTIISSFFDSFSGVLFPLTGIDLLVKNGIDSALFVSDHLGMTPLILACTYGHAQAAKGLVDLGADVRAVDKEGKGALWHLYHPSLSMTTPSSATISTIMSSSQGLRKIPHIPGSERLRGNPKRLRSANAKTFSSLDPSLDHPGNGGKDKDSEVTNTMVVAPISSASSRTSSAAADRRSSTNAPRKGWFYNILDIF